MSGMRHVRYGAGQRLEASYRYKIIETARQATLLACQMRCDAANDMCGELRGEGRGEQVHSIRWKICVDTPKLSARSLLGLTAQWNPINVREPKTI